MQVRDRERGSQIADYRIEAVLGRGGMSVVYLAEDLRLKRRVALKLLTPTLAEDERFRDRFLRESELAASLDHANVIPIYEAGEADGSLFIAMRYVEGSDLKALLRDGALSEERAVLLAGQVAAALDAAHERGLVHGDVKPSNVLIDGRGHAYLADFGLTERVTDERSPAGEAQLMGTIDYVSPEQIRGEDVDGRADVYSLGCLLYECLTGKQPFKRGNDAAVLYAHLEDEPPATGTAADPVLKRALAKSPDERFQTCGELAEGARQALGVAAPRRSRFPLAIAVLVVAAGVASFLGVYLLRGRGTPAGPHGVLLRLDPARNTVVGNRVAIGADPTGIAVGADRVWITTLADSSIWRVDTRSLAATRITAHGAPIGVAFRNGLGFVADSIDGPWGGAGKGVGEVTIVPADGAATSQTIHTGTAMAIASGPEGLWVAREVDAARLSIESSIAANVAQHVPLPPSLGEHSAVAVGAGGVWVLVGALGHRLLRIDPVHRRVTTIPLPFAPAGVAAGPEGVWVTAQLDDVVARIDPVKNRIVATVKVGREPLSVAVGEGAVWVANTIDRTVTRIDPVTDLPVKTIRLGSSPEAITAGDGSVWVATDAS